MSLFQLFDLPLNQLVRKENEFLAEANYFLRRRGEGRPESSIYQFYTELYLYFQFCKYAVKLAIQAKKLSLLNRLRNERRDQR